MRFSLQFTHSPHEVEHRKACEAGLTALGYTYHYARPRYGDKVACWGWRRGQKWRRLGFDVLVFERGYIGDRFAWTSLAWNGLNGRGNAPTIDDGGARFATHHEPLRPWNPHGQYVLICGQVPGDASLQGRDLNPWYQEQADKYADHDLVFRPHPLGARRGAIQELKGAITSNRSLTEDLEGASLVVTYNSNTGVDSLLAGKPVYCDNEGSMAWGVTPESREQWAHRLAWRQWTLDEISSGYALRILCAPTPGAVKGAPTAAKMASVTNP